MIVKAIPAGTASVDLKFASVGMADEQGFNTYLRGNVTDLGDGQRVLVERQLRQIEVDQKIGHGLFVLSKPRSVPWRSAALFEYFSQYDDCSLPSPIPDPLRPDHAINPAQRHLSPATNPVFDTYFFPSVTKDGPPPVCQDCGKRIMNDAHRQFHCRFVHPSDRQRLNQEKYGLGMLNRTNYLLIVLVVVVLFP